jgi:hypothetical protein
VQIADFERGGAGPTADARRRQTTDSSLATKDQEIQKLKMMLLSARDEQADSLRAHLAQLTSLQVALSDAENARQTVEEQFALQRGERGMPQNQSLKQGDQKVSQELAELQGSQDQGQRYEQHLGEAEALVGELRVLLAERERDLSRELALRDQLTQQLVVARRSSELADRALRITRELEEIAARTSPVSARIARVSVRRRFVSALRRIRAGARSGTALLATERLRREFTKSPLFDSAWYVSQRPDLLRTKQEPIDHFVLHGINEGTSTHPLIDVGWIAACTGKSEGSALRSYLEHGRYTALRPTPLFDVDYYRKAARLGSSADALSHYLRHGRASGLSPHPLFDPAFYRSQLPKLTLGSVDPLVHYVLAPFELDPHPLFSTEYYLRQHPELRALGLNPLLHYLEFGSSERTSPHRNFSGAAYLERHKDVAATGLNPLLHYVIFGKAEGRQIDPAA